MSILKVITRFINLSFLFQGFDTTGEHTPLASTFNHNAQHPYQDAITISQPSDGGLFLRLPKDLEGLISEGEFQDIVTNIQTAIQSGENIKTTVLEQFELIFNKFKTGFTEAQVKEAIGKLVGFEDDLIIPIEQLSNTDYLSNQTKGPTDAFKDLALQIVTKLVAIVVKQKNIASVDLAKKNKDSYLETKQGDESIIEWYERNDIKRPKLTFIINRVSTTGDTAPAAGNGILGEDFALLIMGYPAFESTFGQIAQMENLGKQGKNVISQPFKEAFTRIQDRMKEGNTPELQSTLVSIIKTELADLIQEYGFEIQVDAGTFNSINPARVDMQTTYHTITHAQAEAKGIIEHGDELIEAVPSGNGGHMFSTLMSRYLSGVKGTTLVSCNENDMFYRMLETGRFAKTPNTWRERFTYLKNQLKRTKGKFSPEEHAEIWKTLKSGVVSSPSVSMIIETPNNIERLFSIALGSKRANEIKRQYENFEEVRLSVEEIKIFKEIYKIHVERVTAREELETVGEVFVDTGRLVCPHTANAICGLGRYRNHTGDTETKALISETASPWKFLAATAAALHFQTLDETGKNTVDVTGIYREYKGLESDPTGKGVIELINKIKHYYSALGKTFSMDQIPTDLREIYENPTLNLGEIKSADSWNKVTISATEQYVSKFKEQVEGLLAA